MILTRKIFLYIYNNFVFIYLDYIHNLPNGNIDHGEIIQKSCSVKFYKFMPKDLAACSFIALVCIGIHNHLPPPSEKIPADIKANFQKLINQAIDENNAITSQHIQSSIKIFF